MYILPEKITKYPKKFLKLRKKPIKLTFVLKPILLKCYFKIWIFIHRIHRKKFLVGTNKNSPTIFHHIRPSNLLPGHLFQRLPPILHHRRLLLPPPLHTTL